jgi:hypothetical protein
MKKIQSYLERKNVYISLDMILFKANIYMLYIFKAFDVTWFVEYNQNTCQHKFNSFFGRWN